MGEYQESLKKIADSIESKNRIEYGTSFDEQSLQIAMGNIINLQYSPGRNILSEYLRNGANIEDYNKIMNSYTFIPIRTIVEGAMESGSKCSINFDTNWFNYGCKIREYIKIDVNNIEGEKIHILLKYLSGFFPNGVRMSNILSEDMSPVLHIDPDTYYFLTLKVNPKTFNPYGKINNEITELKTLMESTEVGDEDIEKAITDVVNDIYIPWAINVQTEMYNWFMNFQSNYTQAPIKENESLCDGQKSYEITLNVPFSNEPIDWIELIKRTLPLSQAFQCNQMDTPTLSIGFSQNTGSLMQKIFPEIRGDKINV